MVVFCETGRAGCPVWRAMSVMLPESGIAGAKIWLSCFSGQPDVSREARHRRATGLTQGRRRSLAVNTEPPYGATSSSLRRP